MDQEVDVDAILIFLTSLGTAFFSARLSGGSRATLADMTLGVVGGLAGLAVARMLVVDAGVSGLGLPLFLACALTLGLESLRHHSAWL
jgi:hypothetical protein